MPVVRQKKKKADEVPSFDLTTKDCEPPISDLGMKFGIFTVVATLTAA